MNPPSATFPAARLAPNLSHAWGGVWRLTARRMLLPGHWLAVAGMLALLALVCTGFLSGRNARNLYVGWSVEFYFTFLVPTLAFIAAAGAIREEMKARVVDYVLTRPVPRPAFVAFKYLAHIACTQLDFLLGFGVVLGLGLFREVPGLAAAAPALLLAQVLMITVFSALGFLCGVISSRHVVIGLFYAAIIEVGVGQIPTQLSRLSMTRQVRTMLEYLTDPAGPVAAAAPSMWTTGGLMLGFGAVLVAAAAVLFTVREISGAAET